MNENKNALQDVLAYEKQLLADREQLRKLLDDYQGEQDAIVKDKLLFFQSELKHMNHQYELLKKGAEAGAYSSDAVMASPQPAPVQTIPVTEPEQTPAPHVYARPQTNPVSHVYARPQDTHAVRSNTTTPFNEDMLTYQRQEVPVATSKEPFSFEKLVGSSLMGILASGLIFISLILFATLIMPYLGNAVKLIACYLISFVMIGVSLFKLQKNTDNKFYLALAGCGIGALYITLLLTNIYFKYIGDIALFVLIAIWVGFVCYLSRSRNPIFHVIGQIGVTISVIFGSILCADTENTTKFLSLIVFFVISFGTLYITHFDREVAYNKIGNIFGFINLCILLISNLFLEEQICYLFFMVIALVLLAAIFYEKWEVSDFGYGIMVSIYSILFVLAARSFIEYDIIWGICIYIFAIVAIALTEYKPKTFTDGKIFAQITLIVIAVFALAATGGLFYHGYAWLLIVPLAVFGFIRNNNICKYAGLLLTFGYLTDEYTGLIKNIEPAEMFTVGLIVIVLFYLLMWWKKEDYSLPFKVCLHIIGIVFFFTATYEFLLKPIENEHTIDALLFLIVAIYNFAMSKSPFSKNLLTDEKDNVACYNSINLILMGIGLYLISEVTPLHIPVILISLFLFLQNSKNLLEEQEGLWRGIYVGAKFTVLLFVILNSFNAVNYIISSLCLVFAVACIVLGFAKEYKSLRVYGLLLSMISVFKLVMIDMHYENTLGNALSFFISGILCFAISMIYNYIDKKMKNEKNNEE